MILIFFIIFMGLESFISPGLSVGACIGFVYMNPSPSNDSFQLIIANNRDEMYSRPTKTASMWQGHVISGLDEKKGKKGGTWMGVSTHGKVAMLVNIMETAQPGKKGRGMLVSDFLKGKEDMEEYAEVVVADVHQYNPMSLVLMQKQKKNWKCVVLSNTEPVKVEVNQEYLGISNSPFEHPYKKVEDSKKEFKKIVQAFNKVESKEELMVALLKLLRDPTKHWPDSELSKQQSKKLPLKEFSSNFVTSNFYGTRTHSLVLIDGRGRGHYVEVTMVKKAGNNEMGDGQKNLNLEEGLLKDYISEINSPSSPPSSSPSSSSSPPSPPPSPAPSSSSPPPSSVFWSAKIIKFKLD